MVTIEKINIRAKESVTPYIEDIMERVENLDFDFCAYPVEVTISDGKLNGSMTYTPRFEVFVENIYGYFGFHVK